MRKSKFSESEIVAVLKEVESGAAVADVARKHGISAATFYQWRSKYGGMSVSDMQRLRELKQENARLNQFRTIEEAKFTTAQWLPICNELRTHSAIGHLPPMAFKQRWQQQQPLSIDGSG